MAARIRDFRAMLGDVTRRDFLETATTLGIASGLALPVQAGDALPTRRENFDDGWRFSRGDFPDAFRPDFPDRDWRLLDLPHDWSIEGPYAETEPAGGSGGYLPTGIGWYRKPFTPGPAGKSVEILFDGVYQRSEVWINGVPLGMRPNGYISFAYDLTPHIRPDAPNTIAVRVDNSLQPNSRWYSGSGMYRHVWLITRDTLHIPTWGVCVRTTEVSSGRASLEITTRAVNNSDRAAECVLDFDIVSPAGAVVATSRLSKRVPAHGEHSFVQRLEIAAPDLWSPAAPRLYSAHTTIRAEDGRSDSETTPFGIRDARFDADRGFVLNGERVKLNGVCLHGDCGAVGTAVPVRLWERRLAKLKEMGCNAIRCSHNPPAPEFLDLCDTMGFLVMAEAFDEWLQPKAQTPLYGYHRYFAEWGARDLSDMLDRDRNHPSIVIWSAGNEVPDQTDPKGPETLRSLLEIFHAKDPTRPVTVACDNIAAEPVATLPAFLEELDVVGYNYVDRWRDRREKFYSIDRHDFPQRKFIGTESPGLGGVRGAWHLGDEPVIFGERGSNNRIEAEQLQKFVQTYDYVSGDFMWTGIDYLGESSWPSKLASSGVLDTCGFAKDSFYFYHSLWTKTPVLHLFPHWNWKGEEGRIVTVTCYTNCETVELFVNGRSYGVKGFAFPRPGMIERWPVYPPRAKALQTTADLHLSWDVPFVPGTLKAIGRNKGELSMTTERRTTGAPASIRLSADRDRIGPRDVALVTAEILDAGGLLVPTADNEIIFDVGGAGRLLGADSGRPDSHESYQSPRRKAFGGMALAILQSAGGTALMQLSAKSPSLTGATIRIACA